MKGNSWSPTDVFNRCFWGFPVVPSKTYFYSSFSFAFSLTLYKEVACGINMESWSSLNWKGPFKCHLAQSPCNDLQVAHSPFQPDHLCFQGWGIHHPAVQPVPVFHHPIVK